jgi:DNA-directed RNA polymerase specialized sigma subunit
MEIADYMELSSEQKEIVNNNYGLVISYLQSHKIPFEEGHGPACIGLCKAVKAHNPEKGKLSTIAYIFMNSEYIRTIRRIKQKNFDKSVLSLEQPAYASPDLESLTIADTLGNYDNMEELDGYIDLMQILKTFIPSLNSIQKKIFYLRIMEGLNNPEIAERITEEKLTSVDINRIYARQIIPRLKTHMKNNGYECKYLTQKLRNKKKEGE